MMIFENAQDSVGEFQVFDEYFSSISGHSVGKYTHRVSQGKNGKPWVSRVDSVGCSVVNHRVFQVIPQTFLAQWNIT
jgi:hypothetical protein